MAVMTRRAFVVAGLNLSVLSTFGYAKYCEPYWLELVEDCLALPGMTGKLRVAHISDLHAFDAMPLGFIESALDLASQQQPDFACITGDFISHHITDTESYQSILKSFAAKVKTYAITGNHDGGAWVSRGGGYKDTSIVRSLLEKSGIEVLHNSNTIFKRNDTRLQLVGVGDIWAKECDSEAAFDGSHANTPTILLSHNPDSKDLLGKYSWDLMLSGHTHGGQLLVPLIGTTPYAPVQDHRYIAGLKKWGNRFINVSRGVGAIEGMRFNCRPDVTLLEIS